MTLDVVLDLYVQAVNVWVEGFGFEENEYEIDWASEHKMVFYYRFEIISFKQIWYEPR